MTAHAKRVLLAAGIAPWAVVIVSLLWGIWYHATSPRSAPEIPVFPDRLWEFVLLYSLYGIPTAYLSLILFLPLYYVARRFGVASYWNIGTAGLLTCLPAALFYGRPSYVFAGTLIFLLPFGAGVATCFFWIVRRKAEAGAPPNGGPAEPSGSPGVGGEPPAVS